jgi:hydroxymethylpyrimidine kinase/phosphomethylpyrimidine kinase
MKRILTIAGSDSGGGAGMQADIKTITVLGGYGMSVLTALTAQNSMGVQAIHPVPPEFIAQQLDSVLSDIGADAVKTGMLFDRPTIKVVAEKLKRYKIEKVVVDPVMVAKGGDPLLVPEAQDALARDIVPLSYLITPNIPEAGVLCGRSIQTDKDARDAARTIHGMGAKNVLIKGGHREGPAVDILFDGENFFEFKKERVNTPHTHGTGCTYSAAIATFVGQGYPLKDAVGVAKDFIHTAIRFALPLGKGHGPTNHYAFFAREHDRYHVLESLKEGLERLKGLPVAPLIPEVQMNFGYALPYAEAARDIAAFPGRIIRLYNKIATMAGPAFGASQHIAAIILTVMRYHPEYRSAVNIRFSEELIRECKKLGWTVRSFDRTKEPKAIKDREGSTLEWGTDSVLAIEEKVPDIIFDRGDVGKEPMVRILGKKPEDVVDKIVALIN